MTLRRSYTADEVAEMLGISGDSVRRAIARKELPAARLGRRYLVPVEAVEEYRDPEKQMLRRIEALERELETVRASRLRELAATVPLDEVLALLNDLFEVDPLRVGDLRSRVQAESDRADLDATDTVRPPRNANAKASRRLVATAIGRVDVWLWPVKTGWAGVVGGPRPGHRQLAKTHMPLLRELARQARLEYGNPVRNVSLKRRYAILERDGFACRYCGSRAPDVELHIDHVQPVSDEASNGDENLVASCADCNLGKAGR